MGLKMVKRSLLEACLLGILLSVLVVLQQKADDLPTRNLTDLLTGNLILAVCVSVPCIYAAGNCMFRLFGAISFVAGGISGGSRVYGVDRRGRLAELWCGYLGLIIIVFVAVSSVISSFAAHYYYSKVLGMAVIREV